jgi:hypothetical protein
MATARAIFQGHIDGLTAAGLDPVTIPITCAWTVDSAAGAITTINLLVGTTTLTPQTGVPNRLLLLIPPATNTTILYACGATGDTGVALAPNVGHVLVVQTGVPLILKVAAEVDGVQLIWL